MNEGSGQAPLTDEELKAIDWTKKGQNMMNARAAKAALHDAGVSDWRRCIPVTLSQTGGTKSLKRTGS